MRNLHTHTYRCKHAKGTVAQYAHEALLNGIEELGITDHTPLPDGRWDFVRMDISELPSYEQEIDLAAEHFPELLIYKGLECDWAPEYRMFYQDLLESGRMDYLIGAVHWVPFGDSWVYVTQSDSALLSAYASHVINAMETGLFSFIAHPDVFGSGYLVWNDNAEACSRDILSAAEALGIPLEINGLGFRKTSIDTPQGQRKKYPLLPFWELASEYSIQVVCNSDAHKPADVAASIDKARSIASQFGLPEALTPVAHPVYD